MLVQIEARPRATTAATPFVATARSPGDAGAAATTATAVRIHPARPADMADVAPLIDAFARRGLMLPKSLDQLCRTFREFVVARDEAGRLLGCGALRVFSPELAEVSALAVAPHAHGRGVGRRLVEALIADARTLGLETLVALTLEPGFFHRVGFETTSRERFPQKIAADCAGCPRRVGCREVTVAMRVAADPGTTTTDGVTG